LARVRVETGAAQGWPERRGVDRDDGLQPASWVLAEGDLLVTGPFGATAAFVRRREHMRHCGDSSDRARTLVGVGSTAQLRTARRPAAGPGPGHAGPQSPAT